MCCHGNSLSSPEKSDSILKFTDSYIYNLVIHAKKILDVLYRTEISAILAYFCPNLVAMATPCAPLKIQIEYLNSPTPKTAFYTQKVSPYLVQNWNECNFGLFLLKIGCYGNALCSLKNSSSIFEFADPENYTLHAKNVSISCTELKSVQFWLIFAQIWLPWQRPLLP